MLGIEVSPVVQYVIAFAIIAALLGLFAIVLRRIGGKRFNLPGQDRGRGRQPRLGIVDVYDLDRQRQLVLLRRDNVEHLVMLGGPNDLVVESNIVRVPVSRAPAGSEYPVERLAQGEPAPEQGRTGFEPAIAASAGGAVVGIAARNPEPAQREPVMQRPQQAPSAPLRQQAPQQSPYPVQPQQRLEPKTEPVPEPARPEMRAFDRQPSVSEPSVSEPSVSQFPASKPSDPDSSVFEPAASERLTPEPLSPEPLTPDAVPQTPLPVQEVPSQAAPQSPPPAAPQVPPQPVRAVAQAEAPRRTELKSFEPVVTAAPPPPPVPRRGLFGFGRAVEAPAPMPAFPSRPRATPVAPDFTPQRPPSKFTPATEEKPPAADSQGETGVDAVPPTETKPEVPEKPPAPVAAPKSGRPLDDAILSDMARQLEAALKRPAGAVQPSVAQRPAQQSASPRAAVAPPLRAAAPLAPASPLPTTPAPPPSPAPSSAPPPSPADDWPNERKSYRPAVTAAVAVGAVAAIASALRPSPAADAKGSSDPVPPRPYGGRDAAEVNGPAAPVEETGWEDLAQEGLAREDLARDDGLVETRSGAPSETSSVVSRDVASEEATVETGVEIAAEVAAEAGVEATAEADPAFRQQADSIADDDAQEDAQDDAELASGQSPAGSAEEAADVALEPDREPDREPAAETPQQDDEDERSVAVLHAETSPADVAHPEPAPVEPEEKAASEDRPRSAPAAIDPFSVDEIEAEFARLLGRSVEKDTKSL
jgi:flagellar protein FliO/FliZ